MLNIYIISIFITLFNFSNQKQETCKYSVYCNDSMNHCLEKRKTESLEIFEVALSQCKIPSLRYCNVYDSLLVKSESNMNCLADPKTFPTYPGGSCTIDGECLFGLCIDGKCKDSDIGKPCSIHENCPIGSACINDICTTLYKIGQHCDTSHECEFGLICYNKTCIEAYSIEDDIKLDSEAISPKDKPNLFCKSGGFHSVNGVYTCGTLFNKDYDCREECVYTKPNGEEIKIEDNCLCGYNKYRSKHCVLGNGEPQYVEYLNLKKEFMKNKEYTKYCHTVERLSDDICVELRKINRTVSFRKYVQKYNNAKILALEHHRLVDSEPCVKEVLFNYNNNPIIPDQMECPVIKCNYTMPNCLEGTNPFNENGDGIEIYMNDKVCKDQEICEIGSTKHTITPIYLYQNVVGNCKQQTYNHTKRYPGEDCDEINTCVIKGSTCVDGKCTGKSKGESCKSHENCLVGLYCDPEKEICLTQKKEFEKCETTWECGNYLGCYKSVCHQFGGLKETQSISKEDIKNISNSYRSYFCELGKVDSNYSTCVVSDYANSTLEKFKQGNDIFVECKKNEKCYYYDNVTYYSTNCGCGYNSEGKGYCPLPNKYNQEDWKKRQLFRAELTNNKCHTLNRFECYLKNTYENFKMNRETRSKTIEAHFFHNAVPCVYGLFGKENYLQIRALRALIFTIAYVLILL